jgi:hypothetical protein
MKNCTLIFAFIIALALPETSLGQNFPPMAVSPMDLEIARLDSDGPPVARVIYSRPQKKGREIFGGLVPYNKVWRTGANEATELTLYKPMIFGNNRLEAGTYTLYTIPQKDTWTIIINEDTNVWGAFSYKKVKDVARIQVPVQETAAPVEALSMIFKNEDYGVTLLIGWDQVFVEIPFRYAPTE